MDARTHLGLDLAGELGQFFLRPLGPGFGKVEDIGERCFSSA
jgi:hypothetical protein